MADLEVASQTLTATAAICRLSGDMDSGNFDALEDEFNKLLESGVLGLVLDLSGVETLSSAGLGAILNLSRVLKTRQGKLVLCQLRPKIQGDIEMLGLAEILTVSDSLEAAKKQVAALPQK